MPARLDLTIYQGATFRKKLVWKVGGVPVDLTGCYANMYVKEHIDSPTATLIMDNSGSPGSQLAHLITGGNTGEIEMFVDHTRTRYVTIKKGVYDLEVDLPSGDRVRLLQGDVYVDREVTT
jgi:hypothetical protein